MSAQVFFTESKAGDEHSNSRKLRRLFLDLKHKMMMVSLKPRITVEEDCSFHLCGLSQECCIFTSVPNTLQLWRMKASLQFYSDTLQASNFRQQMCKHNWEKWAAATYPQPKWKDSNGMSNCSQIVSPSTLSKFVYVHVSMCVCVLCTMSDGKGCCNPRGTMLTLADTGMMQVSPPTRTFLGPRTPLQQLENRKNNRSIAQTRCVTLL